MRSGFSLVELSIVLVILGLLTGGILAGQSLIRASELRSVSVDYARYGTAVQAFRDKYFALPGDMNNATSVWGVLNATPATCRVTSSTDALTCNGNGNGMVDYFTGSLEYFRFWQHLANAGLIEGSYTGNSGPGSANYHYVPGLNIPVSKLNGAGFGVNYETAYSSNAAHFDSPAGHYVYFGLQSTTYYPYNALLKPEELWNLDTKMDDGVPGRGKVTAYYWSPCTNAANSADVNTTYKLSQTAAVCSIVFTGIFGQY